MIYFPVLLFLLAANKNILVHTQKYASTNKIDNIEYLCHNSFAKICEFGVLTTLSKILFSSDDYCTYSSKLHSDQFLHMLHETNQYLQHNLHPTLSLISKKVIAKVLKIISYD